MKKPWTICPECGVGKGEDHKTGCLRRKAPTIMDYSRQQRRTADGHVEVAARSYGIKPAPMAPLSDERPVRATSVVKPE